MQAKFILKNFLFRSFELIRVHTHVPTGGVVKGLANLNTTPADVLLELVGCSSVGTSPTNSTKLVSVLHQKIMKLLTDTRTLHIPLTVTAYQALQIFLIGKSL